jgi:hypothetical protein
MFLCIDHRHGDDGPPLLFETMVFGADGGEGFCQRYATWREAEAGHRRACAALAAGRRPDEGGDDDRR